MYTPSKAVLEFRFAGEKGLGAGVTASFYSAVAAELQRRAVNVKVRARLTTRLVLAYASAPCCPQEYSFVCSHLCRACVDNHARSTAIKECALVFLTADVPPTSPYPSWRRVLACLTFSGMLCCYGCIGKLSLQPPMWVDNDSMGDPQGFLAPPSGLFPAPLPPIPGSKDGSDCRNGVADASSSSGASASFGGTLFGGDDVGGGGGGAKDKDKSGKALAQRRRSVIGRFRFLGRLAARCLMDGQVRRRHVVSLFKMCVCVCFNDCEHIFYVSGAILSYPILRSGIKASWLLYQ